ncbi:MAG: hypothetical protein ACHQAX_00780 [Gammaproteobacteria bacterium]
MKQFDHVDSTLGFKKDIFVNAICGINDIGILDAAVHRADLNYIFAKNASVPRLCMNALLVPGLLRFYRSNTYFDHYAAQKKVTPDPKKLLLALLIGPTDAITQGGTGVNSFKWFVVQELSQLMNKSSASIIPITGKADLEANGITENVASEIIGAMIDKLSGAAKRAHKLEN